MSDPKNPWGPRKSGDGPGNAWNKNSGNAADEMIDKLQERLKKMMGGGGGGQGSGGSGGSPFHQGAGFLALIGLGALVVWFALGLFRVQEGEVGVVLRFGKMVRIVGPGLQYHLPAPFESVRVQKVSAINRIDGGMTAEAKSGDSEQALTLTSDENMVIISYSVQWRIKDVSEYLFTARDPEGLITVAAESAVREVFGQTTARSALTEGREGISNRAHELLQKILDSYKLGVQIVSFQLQRVEAPPQVIESFNDVQASLVDADRLKNEAESYSNQIIPVARGNAERIKQEAQAYAQKTVAEAEGEASRFNLVYTAYSTNKDVALMRSYMETMQRVLKSAPKIILDPKIGNMVPYLPINELKKPAPEAHSTKTETK